MVNFYYFCPQHIHLSLTNVQLTPHSLEPPLPLITYIHFLFGLYLPWLLYTLISLTFLDISSFLLLYIRPYHLSFFFNIYPATLTTPKLPLILSLLIFSSLVNTHSHILTFSFLLQPLWHHPSYLRLKILNLFHPIGLPSLPPLHPPHLKHLYYSHQTVYTVNIV